MIKKFKFELLLILFFSGNTMVNASSLQCEKTWEKFNTDHIKVSVLDKIKLWKESKSKCKPTGYYFYRLSKLYLSIEDLGKAKYSVMEGLKHRDEAYELNELMDLSVQFTELSFKSLTAPGWPKIEQKILSFVEKHPSLTEGYTLMSSVKLARADYDGAIKYAGKSAYLEGGLSLLTGRTLTIAYTEMEKYKQAIEVGNGVTKLHNELFIDKYFMLAIVRSYVGNNDIDMASRVLKLLITSNPKLIDDADVQKYARYLQQKLREREKIG